MPDLILKFTVQSFTANLLEIKVQNTSGAALDKTLVIQLFPPTYLVSDQIRKAAVDAAKSMKPAGSKSLKGVVTGPQGWSVWARSESHERSLIIVLANAVDEDDNDITPVKLAAEAEFTISIPLDPQANRAALNFLCSYQYGTDEQDLPVLSSLELKPDKLNFTPEVTLTTNHRSPTAVKAGDFVSVIWTIKDGVSATLRGPLPGGNSELTLSADSKAPFKIAGGSLKVAVVSSMTYLLQAEVKRPDGGPNVEVVRMLWLDTANAKHLYLSPRPPSVLPYGLIVIEWAAWGVQDVRISVSGLANRNVPLTQQTLGRFYEGSGIMRVSASHTIRNVKTTSETITISSTTETPKQRLVQVISWMSMEMSGTKGQLLGLAVNAPKIALLTTEGLHIAHVGTSDPSSVMQKLAFTLKSPDPSPFEWKVVTAVGKRFVCLRRPLSSPDFEAAAYTIDGDPDPILPLTLPADIRNFVLAPHGVVDFVGLGNRVYFVIEAPLFAETIRRAFSISFDTIPNKAEYRQEPLLEPLTGYRLAAFDGALYALNRQSGEMLRFAVNENGTLDRPRKAAAAIRKDGAQQESMISKGRIVPLGRNLVVLCPKSFPTAKSLEPYGLKNTLGYEQSESDSDSDNIPQDIFYNPQKDYWGRCGHDLEIKDDAAAAYRGGTSPRLWVVQEEGEQLTLHTLAAGAEDLFVHDYRTEYAPLPLPPPVIKKRTFTIKCAPLRVGPVVENYRKRGFAEFSTIDPLAQATLPSTPDVGEFSFDLTYDAANPKPVTIRRQVARTPTSRTDFDYLLEVTFSGPDLSTATSCYRRVAIGTLSANDVVEGSQVVHSGSTIEVPRPKRFEEKFNLVIVNGSRNLRLRAKGLKGVDEITNQATVTFDHDLPDFSLEFEGKGVTVGVNFNFALPNGIDDSFAGRQPTKLIRINTERGGHTKIPLLKMLMPGDPPLKPQGATAPIEANAGRPVFVCQLDYPF